MADYGLDKTYAAASLGLKGPTGNPSRIGDFLRDQLAEQAKMRDKKKQMGGGTMAQPGAAAWTLLGGPNYGI